MKELLIKEIENKEDGEKRKERGPVGDKEGRERRM